VNYTVIAIGDDYAVEYDCGGVNYCVHVMSRRRTMDAALYEKLLSDANAMGLNPLNLQPKKTLQEGC
jgi:lipocalin